MKRSKRIPNTRLVLAVAELARDKGKLDKFRWNVMNAHWKDGRDIEDNAVIADLAKASGLDPEEAVNAADDPSYLNRVDAMRVEYKTVGVGGIPTFVFGNNAVEGCQPYEVLSAAALQAGAEYRLGEPSS